MVSSNGLVAQLVERGTYNAEVAGSRPARTIFFSIYNFNEIIISYLKTYK